MTTQASPGLLRARRLLRRHQPVVRPDRRLADHADGAEPRLGGGRALLLQRADLWAYDMTYMLYGTFFMLGSAYTLQRGGHIRTDSLLRRNGRRARRGCVDARLLPGVLLSAAAGAALRDLGIFLDVVPAQGERVVTSPWMPVV